jgi:thiol-disulfide isomerase/thioredoxin
MLLSCSRDNAPKNTTQNTNESAQTASMNLAETAEKPSAAKVFALQKVDEAVSGKRPDFAWTEGKTIVKLSDASKGKPVFLNFWGTWCPPCRRELPDIVQLHKEYGDKVVFIGIAMENEEKASKALPIVSTFAQKNNLNYINLVGDDKFIGQISTVYGDIQAVPTTFIIDKNGVIAEKMIGGKTKDEFLTALKKVL